MAASDATAVRFSPVENVFCGTFELNVEATLVLRTLQSHRLPHGFKGARISRVPATVRSMQRRTSRHTLHGSTHVASSRFRQPYRWSECLAAAVLPRVVARGRRITPTLYRDDIYNMLSSHKTVQRADCRKPRVDSGRWEACRTGAARAMRLAPRQSCSVHWYWHVSPPWDPAFLTMPFLTS